MVPASASLCVCARARNVRIYIVYLIIYLMLKRFFCLIKLCLQLYCFSWAKTLHASSYFSWLLSPAQRFRSLSFSSLFALCFIAHSRCPALITRLTIEALSLSIRLDGKCKNCIRLLCLAGVLSILNVEQLAEHRFTTPRISRILHFNHKFAFAFRIWMRLNKFYST